MRNKDNSEEHAFWITNKVFWDAYLYYIVIIKLQT